jgi:hypothetical protein
MLRRSRRSGKTRKILTQAKPRRILEGAAFLGQKAPHGAVAERLKAAVC